MARSDTPSTTRGARSAPLRAVDGRVPGRRGLATRKRLLECTIELLAKTPYRDLKVTDITRAAGTSPATFYQYFVDLETVLLAVAEQTAEEGQQLVELIRAGRGKARPASTARRRSSTASSSSGAPTGRRCASSTCSRPRATGGSGTCGSSC